MGVQRKIRVENKNISGVYLAKSLNTHFVNMAQPWDEVVHSRNNYHANTIFIQPTDENRSLPHFYLLKKKIAGKGTSPAYKRSL